MAAMIASRRMLLSKLLETLSFSPLRRAAAAAAAAPSARFFNGRPDYVGCCGVGSAVYYCFPSIFIDVFDPFDPTRSRRQLLVLEKPAAAASRRGDGGLWRGWDVKEDEEALYLRVDIPGLGKEHLTVWKEQNTIVLSGEGEKESEGARRFSSRIDLPADYFKMDQIKVEMKNGVLKVVMPKAKEEDSEDEFRVNVD